MGQEWFANHCEPKANPVRDARSTGGPNREPRTPPLRGFGFAIGTTPGRTRELVLGEWPVGVVIEQ